MKHAARWTDEATKALFAGLDELSIKVKPEVAEKLVGLGELLIAENQRINLTSIRDPVQIAAKHFIDSLSIVRVLDLNSPMTCLDIGTGAGFPGLPIALVFPSVKVTFLESTRKKLDFVIRASKSLGIAQATFEWNRAEVAVRRNDLRERFDLAVVRACGHLATVCELAIPFVKIGGRVIAYKGPEVDRELEAAHICCENLGARVSATQRFNLPILKDKRTLVEIVKEKPTHEQFPRGANLPKLKPLGMREP